MICGPWDTLTPGECAGGCDIPVDTPPEVLAVAEEQASVMLRRLSGLYYGVCTDTIRPLGECPVCRTAPCCGAGDRIRLHTNLGPVATVDVVRVNGVVVPPAEWRFYPSSGLLYKVDGAWPMSDPRTGPGTLEVDVTVGVEPDAWALAVWRELACELVKLCTGAKGCRLPRNATSVSSQGVTISLSEVEMKTFIPAVAGWVAAINPYAKTAPSLVSSPDLDHAWARGGSCGCS